MLPGWARAGAADMLPSESSASFESARGRARVRAAAAAALGPAPPAPGPRRAAGETSHLTGHLTGHVTGHVTAGETGVQSLVCAEGRRVPGDGATPPPPQKKIHTGERRGQADLGLR